MSRRVKNMRGFMRCQPSDSTTQGKPNNPVVWFKSSDPWSLLLKYYKNLLLIIMAITVNKSWLRKLNLTVSSILFIHRRFIVAIHILANPFICKMSDVIYLCNLYIKLREIPKVELLYISFNKRKTFQIFFSSVMTYPH